MDLGYTDLIFQGNPIPGPLNPVGWSGGVGQTEEPQNGSKWLVSYGWFMPKRSKESKHLSRSFKIHRFRISRLGIAGALLSQGRRRWSRGGRMGTPSAVLEPRFFSWVVSDGVWVKTEVLSISPAHHGFYTTSCPNIVAWSSPVYIDISNGHRWCQMSNDSLEPKLDLVVAREMGVTWGYTTLLAHRLCLATKVFPRFGGSFKSLERMSIFSSLHL